MNLGVKEKYTRRSKCTHVKSSILTSGARKETKARNKPKWKGMEESREMNTVLEDSNEEKLIESSAKCWKDKWEKRWKRKRTEIKGLDKRNKSLDSLHFTEEYKLWMNNCRGEFSDKESVAERRKRMFIWEALKISSFNVDGTNDVDDFFRKLDNFL